MHSAVAAPSDGEHCRPASPRRSSADRNSRPLSRDGHAPQSHSGSCHSKPRVNMVTPEEYESLPPSIQKKYFSSVERLRIAQQAASQKRKKQQIPRNQPWSSPKPSLDSVRPKTAQSFRTSSSFSQSKRQTVVRTEADVNEDQALRFLSLPDKVKRSHFTQEELTLLAESSERALGIAITSDDSVSRRATIDRNGSIGSSYYQSSISDDLDEFEKDWYELEMESTAGSEPGAREMEILRMYVRTRQGSVSSTYSAQAPRSLDGIASGSRRKSLARKRAMSLAPLPLPPPQLLPAVPPLPSPTSLRTMGTVKSPGALSTPTETSKTKYYKDTDARSKLRAFLASPEKFDEALEFGFPTERPIDDLSGSFTSNDALQVHMEEPSVANSKDDEDLSSNGSPRTPAGFSDCFNPPSTTHSSVDSAVAIPVMSPGKIMPRTLSPELNGREMTLRMTLTRPELRAPEQQLYAFQRKGVSCVDLTTKDPLALETLFVCDDHSGAHGAFAVSRPSKGGLKKVWKNLRMGRSAS